MNYIWIFIGGGLGSVARFELGQKVSKIAGTSFPFATICINIISCFILGLLFNLLVGKGTGTQTARLLLGVGFCGGFSTFSTFTLESFELFRSGNYIYAGANIILSVVICLFGFWAGWSVSKIF